MIPATSEVVRANPVPGKSMVAIERNRVPDRDHVRVARAAVVRAGDVNLNQAVENQVLQVDAGIQVILIKNTGM